MQLAVSVKRWLYRVSPVRVIPVLFLFTVLIFTALLLLPVARNSGHAASFTEAFFTATSAVTVTGLTVVDTVAHWSIFGKAVILAAVQIGGIGIITMTSLLMMLVSHRLKLTQRNWVSSETNVSEFGTIRPLLGLTIRVSLLIEAILAVFFFPSMYQEYGKVGQSLWHSVFYSISSFNNSGFSSTAESLAPFANQWLFSIPLLLGVFLGSIGFPVYMNIFRKWRTPRAWSLHTKLTLTGSVVLFVLGSALLAGFEWTNPATLGQLSGNERVIASLYNGIMPRSTGFSLIDYGHLHPESTLATTALMFVGGGSASTAGGIKVSTLAVLILAITAEARGTRDITAFGRRIPHSSVRLAIAVTFLAATVVLVATLIILTISEFELHQVLFETVSAFATVGLSTGITPNLSAGGQYVLILLMFWGRVGTITLVAALNLRQRNNLIRFPEERPIIG